MHKDKLPIITIDGPAGVGKTTLAHSLAAKLDLPYLDTGAMFRFVALKLGEEALHLPENQLLKKLQSLHFEISGKGKDTILLCNGESSGSQLRTEKIANLASTLATLPVVRKELQKAQQRLGNEKALIAEGRDMGTVIFPNAALKIFLEASPSIRAKRRFQQLVERGANPDFGQLEDQIRERDKRDRTRSVAPLIPAEDAIEIDTDNLSLDESFTRIMDLIIQIPEYFKTI